MNEMTPKQLWKLAYRLVRLKEYEGAVAADWDYAHNPSDEEWYYADLYQQVIDDCNRQRREIEPLIPEGYQEAAFKCYRRRFDKVPPPKLPHLANNFGIAPFSHMPWRSDERDWYIGHYDFRMESPWMGEEWNRERRERFIRRAREVFGLEREMRPCADCGKPTQRLWYDAPICQECYEKQIPPPTSLDDIPF